MRKSLIFSLLILLVCTSCTHAEENGKNSYWEKSSSWFGGENSEVSGDKVDVLYFVSTNVLSAKDEQGNESMTSRLTDDDLYYINMELQYVKDSIFGPDFNFFSPYYHQYTFNSFNNHPEKMDSVRKEVNKEICEAFDYYMAKQNRNRRFILAGFSQGGDMVMNILRHMKKKQYSRMVAAYVLGYKVTASDTLNYSTIVPAKGETDTGVTIAFNSVLSKEGIWDAVTEGTVACINPVNWKTDATPASFTFEGRPHTVHVDEASKVLIVDTDPTPYYKWMSETPPFSTMNLSKDCLHHWDILFYNKYLRANALARSKK